MLYPSHITGPQIQEHRSSVFANTKGTNQPVHPGGLVSAIVIRLLDSIILHLIQRASDTRKRVFSVCEQQSRKPAYASAQSDQCLC